MKDWEQEPPVVHLSWTEEDGAAARPARTPLVAAGSEPRCCHSAHAGPADRAQGAFSQEGHPPGLPDMPSRLSMLCAADESAAVRLLAFGSFSLGCAALPGTDPNRATVQQQPAPRILHVSACLLWLVSVSQLLQRILRPEWRCQLTIMLCCIAQAEMTRDLSRLCTISVQKASGNRCHLTSLVSLCWQVR